MNTLLKPLLMTVLYRTLGALLLVSFVAPRLNAQVATTLQIIHNAPESSLSPLAVWAGIPLGTSTIFAPVTQNLSFRGATPAITGFPPTISSLSQLVGLPLQANLTRVTSTNGTSELIRGVGGLRLGAGANFVFVQGLSDSTGYAVNPQGRDRSLKLSVLPDTALTSIPNGASRLIFVHGSTDAPQIDIVIRELNRIVTNTAPLSYNELIGDLIPTADYTVDVYSNNRTTLVNSYLLPLRQLQGDGRRFLVMATGFINPAQNRNGAPFGLLAIPHTTPGTPSLLATTTPPSINPFGTTTLPAISLQAIHASADPAASPVGVWLGAMLMPNVLQYFPITTNFPFRTATPTITSIGGVLPLSAALGMPFNLNITASNQSAATPALRSFSGYMLQQSGNWAIAEGVLDVTRFAPNPNGANIAFTIRSVADTVKSVSNQSARLLFSNSVTDSRPIEILLPGTSIVIGPLGYGERGLSAEFPLGDYTFDVRYPGTTAILGTFKAELARQNLGGKRVLVIATGFISPARNQGGSSLGLLAVVNDSSGRSFMMPTLALSVRDANGITFQANGMMIHPVAPNPVRDQTTVSFSLNEPVQVEMRLMDMQGKTVWTLPTQSFASGKHTQTLDVQNLAQGSYIVQLSNGAGHSVMTRLVVVR